MLLTPFDLKRLESYANNALDYHVVLDLIPTIAALYFDRRLGPDVRLSAVQSAILLGLGLQRKTLEDLEVRSPPGARLPSTSDVAVPFVEGSRRPSQPSSRALRQARSKDRQAPAGVAEERHRRHCS